MTCLDMRRRNPSPWQVPARSGRRRARGWTARGAVPVGLCRPPCLLESGGTTVGASDERGRGRGSISSKRTRCRGPDRGRRIGAEMTAARGCRDGGAPEGTGLGIRRFSPPPQHRHGLFPLLVKSFFIRLVFHSFRSVHLHFTFVTVLVTSPFIANHQHHTYNSSG
jgi:hypothetical protein